MRRLGRGRHGVDVPPARQNSERGAITVLTAMCMVVLLIMFAMVVDFGLAYAEKAQLQNGADAAALAVAADCGQRIGTATACPANGINPAQQAIADGLANGNSNDNQSQVVLANSGGVITAKTSTISGGNHFLSMPLAALTGFETAEIRAMAQASWGGIKSGTPVLPITVGACELDPMDAVDRRLVIHGKQKCDAWNTSAGLNMPGGFGWLDATSECHPNITVNDVWVDSKTGASIPNGCSTLFNASLANQEVLIPIFGFADGTGANGKYKIIGWGVFVVKGWNFPSTNYNWSFGGDQKGLYGHFIKKLSFEAGFTYGGSTEYGVTIAKLVK